MTRGFISQVPDVMLQKAEMRRAIASPQISFCVYSRLSLEASAIQGSNTK